MKLSTRLKDCEVGYRSKTEEQKETIIAQHEVVESVQAGSTKRMIARRKIDCLVPDWQGVQQQEGRSGVLIKQSKE